MRPEVIYSSHGPRVWEQDLTGPLGHTGDALGDRVTTGAAGGGLRRDKAVVALVPGENEFGSQNDSEAAGGEAGAVTHPWGGGLGLGNLEAGTELGPGPLLAAQ